ncbi:Dolichol-phosphate mannose synthase subunit 2 [Bienertia sinuspersici]
MKLKQVEKANQELLGHLEDVEIQNRTLSICLNDVEEKFDGKIQAILNASLINENDYSMDLADRAIGFLLCCISLSIFAYYIFVIIMIYVYDIIKINFIYLFIYGVLHPFVDDDHFIHNYFLPQEYAIVIPILAGVALVCFLCVFIGSVMLKLIRNKA